MTQFHRQMSKTQTKQTGTGTSSSASDVVSTDPSQSEQNIMEPSQFCSLPASSQLKKMPTGPSVLRLTE